jgi:hypothetical protein
MKNNRLLLLFALLAISVVETSCGRPSKESATAEFNRILNTYADSNATEAERALLDYLQNLDKYQKQRREGIEYNYIRWVTHARLFSLYSFTGKTNEADVHYRISLRDYGLWRRSENQPVLIHSREDLMRAVEKLDARLEIAWKRARMQ